MNCMRVFILRHGEKMGCHLTAPSSIWVSILTPFFQPFLRVEMEYGEEFPLYCSLTGH